MSKTKERLQALVKRCRLQPGDRPRLREGDASWGDGGKISNRRKKELETLLAQDVARLSEKQELLFASRTWSVLIILQALDAAGKDGTIRHVMSGVNPQGCEVHAFKQPSSDELDHPFLWRCDKVLPARGHIGIFNRSYYEEVIVTRVHPELIEAERLPRAEVDKKLWNDRYDDINAFERHLDRNGVRILKFFLHVSKREQRKRLLERIDDSRKHWKFSLQDLRERDFWDAYIDAYQKCLRKTTTAWAPWYVVPADDKRVARALVAEIVVHAIGELRLGYPKTTRALKKELQKAKVRLERQKG